MPKGVYDRSGNTATAALRAKARSATMQTTTEVFEDENTQQQGTPARVARSGYGALAVYKLTPTGCVRIAVNVQSIDEVLSRPGYSATCFDCGRNDCLYDTSIRGEISTNKCDGKPSRVYRICPEGTCRKRIYDTRPTGEFLVDEFDHSNRDDSNDPNVIGNDDLPKQTPEQFTLSKLEMHVLGFHPELARTLGMRKGEELPVPVVMG